MPLHEAWVLWCLVFVAFAVGLVLAHLYWPLERRLDDEFDRGYNKAASDAWMWAEPEDVPRSDDSEGRIAEESGLATMPGAHAGPGHTIYAELTMLGAQEELDEVLREVPDVDPDWHPAFLARSDAWLAEWRANLGLEEAA